MYVSLDGEGVGSEKFRPKSIEYQQILVYFIICSYFVHVDLTPYLCIDFSCSFQVGVLQ